MIGYTQNKILIQFIQRKEMYMSEVVVVVTGEISDIITKLTQRAEYLCVDNQR